MPLPYRKANEAMTGNTGDDPIREQARQGLGQGKILVHGYATNVGDSRARTRRVQLLMPRGACPQLDLPGHRVPDVICACADVLSGHEFFDPPLQCFVPEPSDRSLVTVCDVHGCLRVLTACELVVSNAS